MRILPASFYVIAKELPIKQNINIINNISSLTHAHNISKISYNIYTFIVKELLSNNDSLYNTIITGIDNSFKYYSKNPEYIKDLNNFNRIFNKNILNSNIDKINSSGYVVSTLEASLWCLINTNNYKSSILKSANLDEDTDTNAAITGSLAGLYYGYDNILIKWINNLAKKEYLKKISYNFYNSLL